MYTMTTQEVIDELNAWYESASDPTELQVLDNTIDRLVRLERQKPRPIETVPNGEHVLVWSPEYGWYQTRFSGMDAAAKIATGWTHWTPMPPRPEEE